MKTFRILLILLSIITIGLFSHCDREKMETLGYGETLLFSFEGIDAKRNISGRYYASASPEGQQFSLSVVNPRCAWLQMDVSIDKKDSFYYPDFWSLSEVSDTWGKCSITSKSHPITLDFEIPANTSTESKTISLTLSYGNSFQYLRLTQQPMELNN